MMESKSLAPAATATIKLVECLSQAGHSMGLAELSSVTGLNKNMITRTLSSLLEARWITLNEETGRYTLSLQLFQLASTALGKKTLMRCAGPYLQRLSDVTEECIQLAVLSDNQAVYISQLDSQKTAGIHGKIGAGYSLEHTAPGKVLDAFINNNPSGADIRARGYATDDEEYGCGVICIAAPVFDYTGKAIAAVCIASLTVTQSLTELTNKYLDVLLEQTMALSYELGYKKTTDSNN